MKLSEIAAKLLGLEQRINDADKTKATVTESAIVALQNDFKAVKADVEGKLSQSSADLETAQASIKSLTGEKETLTTEKSGIVSALVAACVAVKVEGGDEAKIKALTPSAQITALQTAVSNTLASLNVPAAAIPAAKPATSAADTDKPKAKGRELFAQSIKINS